MTASSIASNTATISAPFLCVFYDRERNEAFLFNHAHHVCILPQGFEAVKHAEKIDRAKPVALQFILDSGHKRVRFENQSDVVRVERKKTRKKAAQIS